MYVYVTCVYVCLSWIMPQPTECVFQVCVTWLRYWFTSAPDVPLSCWTSPQAGPHQEATLPLEPPISTPTTQISRHDPGAARGSWGCQNQQAHKNILRESWENTAASRGDPAWGHPQSTIQSTLVLPSESRRFFLSPLQGRTHQVYFCPFLSWSKKKLETAFLKNLQKNM